MNAGMNAKRWIGVGLMVVLSALLATVNVAAMEARQVYRIAPLADHCQVLFSEAGELFVPVDEAAAGCGELVHATVQSIHQAGATAYVWLEADGQSEVRIFVNQGAVWEHIAQGAEPYPYYLYELGQESGPASLSAPIELSSSRYTVDTEAEFSYLVDLENAYIEQFNPAPTGGHASPSVSVDRRGENYWDEWFARQEGSSLVTPSRAGILADDQVDLIAAAERELALTGGSELNTLADLLREMYGSAWHGQVLGSEDLARELQ